MVIRYVSGFRPQLSNPHDYPLMAHKHKLSYSKGLGPDMHVCMSNNSNRSECLIRSLTCAVVSVPWMHGRTLPSHYVTFVPPESRLGEI